MPITGLVPAKLTPNLCRLKYPISTHEPKCQAFFDQGLAYFYSYVYMEAARSFETAALYESECPIVWWGLSRALENWGKSNHNEWLRKSYALREQANEREKRLILARMQVTGQMPSGGTTDKQVDDAISTIDNLIALYDDDEEAWFFRAQLAQRASPGDPSAPVPFYKALLRLNPLHPGANHELIHYYENSGQPALGLISAENYIKSSPGIPHAFHMQAHLAMRLGRWARTTDRSLHAIELQRAYHNEMHVPPNQDDQFEHHLEITLRALIHDGRFKEAEGIKSEQRSCGYKPWQLWVRLHLTERDWDKVRKVIEEMKSSGQSKGAIAYYSALLYLSRGDPQGALPEIEVLQQCLRNSKSGISNKTLSARERFWQRLRQPHSNVDLDLHLWEAQGRYLCQTGDADTGMKLLARVVEKTKNRSDAHAWGNGAYYLEIWGIAALHNRKDAVAEEAFLEGLAHDSGSVRSALGLHVLCERQGRKEEARRFSALAHRLWNRADPDRLKIELAAMKHPAGM
jgi:tetratricopeptide (TPR) repeat protein